jgi:hypothetical protein
MLYDFKLSVVSFENVVVLSLYTLESIEKVCLRWESKIKFAKRWKSMLKGEKVWDIVLEAEKVY